MKTLYLDLLQDHIPFFVQCTNGKGKIENPSTYKLTIYEEDGEDAFFSNKEISGSPFTPININSKTGLWGVLIPKSAFRSGKYYLALWEMKVDGINSAKAEKYFVCNSTSFHNPESSFTLIYRLRDEETGKPIKVARVEVSTDEHGHQQIFSGYTNNQGEISFEIKQDLLPDQLYFWRKRNGFEFDNPDIQKVFDLDGTGRDITSGISHP